MCILHTQLSELSNLRPELAPKPALEPASEPAPKPAPKLGMAATRQMTHEQEILRDMLSEIPCFSGDEATRLASHFDNMGHMMHVLVNQDQHQIRLVVLSYF